MSRHPLWERMLAVFGQELVGTRDDRPDDPKTNVVAITRATARSHEDAIVRLG
ncbi:MAG TPA: hypothetical protein VH247_15650 [Thermoleophilaceae bacterium]|nr:hypothetical protein [Thermoleophilaceae bacterium]